MSTVLATACRMVWQTGPYYTNGQVHADSTRTLVLATRSSAINYGYRHRLESFSGTQGNKRTPAAPMADPLGDLRGIRRLAWGECAQCGAFADPFAAGTAAAFRPAGADCRFPGVQPLARSHAAARQRRRKPRAPCARVLPASP